LLPEQEGEREHIRRLQEDFKAEQRQLRELIGSTADLIADHRSAADFKAEAKSLITVLARRWGAEITLETRFPERRLPGPLVFELLQVLREAISNAVRHGHAKSVNIRASRKGDELELVIADDGSGMPVHGVFDMAQLKDMALGPMSLRGRVAGLGGNLVIDSSPRGATLTITAPLAARTFAVEAG
jgi:signal transduction histidine kinase